MKTKEKYPCSSCGVMTNNSHGPELNLCWKCFVQNKFETRIPNGPLLFNESLNVDVQLRGTVGITKTQAQVLEDRLNYLFPNRPKKYRFSKVLQYVRMLILNDLGYSGGEK